MQPIHVPDDWPEDGLLTFEEFATSSESHNAPSATGDAEASDLAGNRLEGTGRLYLTVA